MSRARVPELCATLVLSVAAVLLSQCGSRTELDGAPTDATVKDSAKAKDVESETGDDAGDADVELDAATDACGCQSTLAEFCADAVYGCPPSFDASALADWLDASHWTAPLGYQYVCVDGCALTAVEVVTQDDTWFHYLFDNGRLVGAVGGCILCPSTCAADPSDCPPPVCLTLGGSVDSSVNSCADN